MSLSSPDSVRSNLDFSNKWELAAHQLDDLYLSWLFHHSQFEPLEILKNWFKICLFKLQVFLSTHYLYIFEIQLGNRPVGPPCRPSIIDRPSVNLSGREFQVLTTLWCKRSPQIPSKSFTPLPKCMSSSFMDKGIWFLSLPYPCT